MLPCRSVLHFLLVILLGVVSFITAIASIFMVLEISERRNIPFYYTPGFFPLIVSAVLFLLLLWSVAASFKDLRQGLTGTRFELGKTLWSHGANIGFAVLLTVYVGSLGRIPFLVSTPLFLTFSMLLGTRRLDYTNIVLILVGSLVLAYSISILLRDVLFIPIA